MFVCVKCGVHVGDVLCGVCCAGCVYVRSARMVCDTCPLVSGTRVVHAAAQVWCMLHTLI